MTEDSDQPRRAETDDRFPSGEWRGFFLEPQTGARRYWMDLCLSFSEGHVNGNGRDLISDFVIKGRYDTTSGDVRLDKHYVGRHHVYCKGCADGTNVGIWGVWEVGPDYRGGFHIWPKGMPDPTQPDAKAEADLPVADEAGALVG